MAFWTFWSIKQNKFNSDTPSFITKLRILNLRSVTEAIMVKNIILSSMDSIPRRAARIWPHFGKPLLKQSGNSTKKITTRQTSDQL